MHEEELIKEKINMSIYELMACEKDGRPNLRRNVKRLIEKTKDCIKYGDRENDELCNDSPCSNQNYLDTYIDDFWFVNCPGSLSVSEQDKQVRILIHQILVEGTHDIGGEENEKKTLGESPPPLKKMKHNLIYRRKTKDPFFKFKDIANSYGRKPNFSKETPVFSPKARKKPLDSSRFERRFDFLKEPPRR